MALHLVESKPLARVLPQAAANEVLKLRGNVLREIYPPLNDSPHGVLLRRLIEGSRSGGKLVGQDAD